MLSTSRRTIVAGAVLTTLGLATGVAYSRIEQDSHYARDVAAGAVIGTFIGRTIVDRHQAERDGFHFQPLLSKAGFGFMGTRDF